MRSLDRFEQCSSVFPQPTEYVRRMQTIRLCSGETLEAWIYLYNWPVDQLELVPSGDFFEARGR